MSTKLFLRYAKITFSLLSHTFLHTTPSLSFFIYPSIFFLLQLRIPLLGFFAFSFVPLHSACFFFRICLLFICKHTLQQISIFSCTKKCRVRSLGRDWNGKRLREKVKKISKNEKISPMLRKESKVTKKKANKLTRFFFQIIFIC